MSASKHSKEFLPHFCTARYFVELLVFSELLTLIIVISNSTQLDHPIQSFFLNSIFILSLSLLGAMLICLFRKWLNRLKLWQGFCCCLIVVMGLSVLLSLITLYISNNFFLRLNLGFSDLGFMLKNLCLTAIVTVGYCRYLYVQRAWQLGLEAETNAVYHALQARIRPHFLFNSMNMIASLIPNSPDIAEQVVFELAALFRSSLSHAQTLSTFAEELELCQQYLHIEQLRLGNRLEIEWHDQVDCPVKIPAFLIQPLIENAVYHGIQTRIAGGKLYFHACIEGQYLYITIKNPTSLKQIGHPNYKTPGLHEAVNNIKHRLALLYHQEASLTLTPQGEEMLTQLIIPLIPTEL